MAKIKIGVDLEGNITGQLKLVENAIKRIEKLNTTTLKIKVDDSQLNSLMTKLDKVEKGLKIQLKASNISDLENQLNNLKVKLKVDNLRDIESQLSNLRLNVTDSGLEDARRSIERLSGGTIKLKVDTSELDALEGRIANLLGTGSGQVVGNSGGSGGVLEGAAQGGLMSYLSGGSIVGGLTGGAAVAGVGMSLNAYGDFNDVYKYLRQSLGSSEKADKVYDALLKVYKSGINTDLNALAIAGGDLGKLLSTNKNISDNELYKLLSLNTIWERSYGTDSKELFNTLNGLMVKEGETLDYYLNLLNSGFQSGANSIRQDFLDSIQEFRDQYAFAGFNSRDMVSMYTNAVSAGDWNTDALGNTMLELNTNLAELLSVGNDDDMRNVRDALNDIGLDWYSVMEDWEAGGDRAKKVTVDIAKALLEVDRNTRRVAGTELFKTPFEDHMDAILEAYVNGTGYLEQFSDTASDTINQDLETFNTQLNSFNNNMKALLGTFGGEFAEAAVPVLTGLNTLLGFINEKLADSGKESNYLKDVFFLMIDPTGQLRNLFDMIGNIINGIDDDTNVWGSAVKNVGDFFSGILETVKKIWGYVKEILGSGWDLLTTGGGNGFTNYLKNNPISQFLFGTEGNKSINTGSKGNTSGYGVSLRPNIQGNGSMLPGASGATVNSNLYLQDGPLYKKVSDDRTRFQKRSR